MNELISKFIEQQLEFKKLKHIAGNDDCKYNSNYDCKLCSIKSKEKKGEFILIGNTHHDYIENVINKFEELKKFGYEEEKIKIDITKGLCNEKNILIFLKQNGQEKIKDIIKTIENGNCYKVSAKMEHCLAVELLDLIDFFEIKDLFIK